MKSVWYINTYFFYLYIVNTIYNTVKNPSLPIANQSYLEPWLKGAFTACGQLVDNIGSTLWTTY